MRKILYITSVLFLLVLLSGCNFHTDIANKADQLEKSFNELETVINRLDKKSTITEKDQRIIATQITIVHKSIEAFSKEYVPHFLKDVHKETIKNLNHKDVLLLKMRKKVMEGNIIKRDIKIIKREMADDCNISIFSK